MAKQMGRPVTNKYKVAPSLWKHWTPAERRMFNRMFHELRPSQQNIFNPGYPLTRANWNALRFEVAMTAAELV